MTLSIDSRSYAGSIGNKLTLTAADKQPMRVEIQQEQKSLGFYLNRNY